MLYIHSLFHIDTSDNSEEQAVEAESLPSDVEEVVDDVTEDIVHEHDVEVELQEGIMGEAL